MHEQADAAFCTNAVWRSASKYHGRPLGARMHTAVKALRVT